MNMFESHAHPDHPFIEDKEAYIRSMRQAGISKLVIAPITYESNYTSMEYFPEEKFPEIYFAKGLHPKCALNAAMWDKKQMTSFEELILDHRVVALKSGIDLCKMKIQEHQKSRQYEFLLLFMELAYKYNKPLVLHIREAAAEAIDFFEKHPLKTEAEVHCFSYDKKVMWRFVDLGIRYFGIGGMVTRSGNTELREAVREMPLTMILLETDSPFVRVEGDEEKINTSAKALPIIAEEVATLKGISVEEVVGATYENACKFFGLEED